MKRDKQQDTKAVKERRSYQRPELVLLGNVPDLTRGNGAVTNDGRGLFG